MPIDPRYAVFNPHAKPVEDLPVIYGFNNGGPTGFMEAVLVAEDGTPLGGHLCSNQWYMPGDLGILEGTHPDRHEGFRKHYPDGYRMEFVEDDNRDTHAGFQTALARNAEKGTETK